MVVIVVIIITFTKQKQNEKMTKVWEITKKVAGWIGTKLKSTYAAEWTVIGLGVWLILTQAKTLGIVIVVLGILYLISAISKNDTTVK